MLGLLPRGLGLVASLSAVSHGCKLAASTLEVIGANIPGRFPSTGHDPVLVTQAKERLSSQPHNSSQAVQHVEDRLDDLRCIVEEMQAQLLQLQRANPTLEQWNKCKKVLDTTLTHCRGRIKQTPNRPEWLATLGEVLNLYDELEHTLRLAQPPAASPVAKED